MIVEHSNSLSFSVAMDFLKHITWFVTSLSTMTCVERMFCFVATNSSKACDDVPSVPRFPKYGKHNSHTTLTWVAYRSMMEWSEPAPQNLYHHVHSIPNPLGIVNGTVHKRPPHQVPNPPNHHLVRPRRSSNGGNFRLSRINLAPSYIRKNPSTQLNRNLGYTHASTALHPIHDVADIGLARIK